MSRHAWLYILSVILAGVLLSALASPDTAPSTSQWLTFAVLAMSATLAQLFKARAPGHQSYHPTLAFLFAGVLLLHPALFVLLVVIPHVVEWTKERWVNSPRLRAWYLQPFNMATHIIAGSTAHGVYSALESRAFMLSGPLSVLSMTAAALAYLFLNHLLIGLALVLARRVSWRESGVLDSENLVIDLILLWLGCVLGVLWKANYWLVLPAASPLVLMYRALKIPQLKKEAQTDDKTGLWNARHFVKLFTSEIERAKRFERPLAVLMADLDLLRNINNTYGHLAGDAVLMGIGQIIRETTREYDIAGRFGGEEFCIVLPEAGPTDADAFAERLREAVESASFEVQTSPTAIRATMSLGVASFPRDATTLMELIHEADVAVYYAKVKGRNRVVSALEVPHSLRLQSPPIDDRLSAPYVAPFVPRPELAKQDSMHRHLRAPEQPVEGKEKPRTAMREYPKALLWLFIGGVIAAGVGLTTLGFTSGPQPDLATIGLLTGLALMAQLLQIQNIYGESSISVSVAVNFAAALMVGLPGVALVSVTIAVAHMFQHRPRLYKTPFNWGTHVLAGSAPALAMSALRISLQARHLMLLAILTLGAALVYYVVETGLIAMAISLSQGTSLMTTWRERYRWLAEHYLVLGIMGLFLGMAHTALGPLSALVFVLPVLMMRYAQKQYVQRTERSVRELKRMNEELNLANDEVMAASQAIPQLNDERFLILTKIIEARDSYMAGHAARVAKYATATELGLSSKRVGQVRQAGFLHGIGKVGVSEGVVHKPKGLTPEEHEYFQTGLWRQEHRF